MSYTSESKFPNTVKLAQLQKVVDLLGYKKFRTNPNLPNMLGSYFWFDENDYRSWTGVELQIYRNSGKITLDTRSRSSRSHWDLCHQNVTLKTVRDLFGGHFTTDAGRNRYWHPDEPPPSSLSSGCYLARWRFHNALQKIDLYLMSRGLEGTIAREAPSGLQFLDEINPRLLSNNLIVPYAIAVWEEYFRATFTAVLKYSSMREAALKKARLSHSQLEQIAVAGLPIERAISECFSFQRPSLIGQNFKLLDSKLDIGGVMHKPYKRRKISLFNSIESLVEARNSFVHTGDMNMELYDKKLQTQLVDIVKAVDRSYTAIGKHYGFQLIRDY